MSYIQYGNLADLARSSSDPIYSTGTIWTDHANHKMYKYVKYVDATAGVAGNVAYYEGGASPDGYTVSEVTSDLSDSVNVGAGVLQGTPAENEYGWIQIKGSATLTTGLTAGADGNAATPVGAGADGTLDVSGAVTDHVCAIMEDQSEDIIVCDFPE